MVRARPSGLRKLVSTLLIAGALAITSSLPAGALPALTGDAYFEAPNSGYEGTYEWRGIMAYTYVYNWVLPDGWSQHVSSVYIRHPVSTNLRHMEIGVYKRNFTVAVTFFQWCNSSWDVLAIDTYDIGYVNPGQTPKLLIRNTTMGTPDGVDERWIMSWNDVIYFNQLHPLTYGQAVEAAETMYVGDDNRAYWYESKRTSKPASWTYWTASRVKFNDDWIYDFYKVNETKWYNQ